MTLDDLPSDASLFKIIPAYEYQKEGEQCNNLIKNISDLCQ